MADTGTPVVFVHGLWLHPDSWGDWVDLFRTAGYTAVAPGWPGVAGNVQWTREHPDRVAGKGLDEVVQHYAAIIRGLPGRPVLIGHSFGGLVVQRLLGQDLAAAAVAIDAAPIKGVVTLPPSALRVASVALRNPVNWRRAVSLTPKQFRYGFGNTLSAGESAELYDRWSVPSTGRPLFEAAVANLSPRSPARVDTGRETRGPLLLVAGGRDNTVPATVTRSTWKLYNKSPAITHYREFADRGHSLTIDSGWREVADLVLAWVKEHGGQPSEDQAGG
jgi:non-heme chloroperoxidase